jgi:hypothetical protein
MDMCLNFIVKARTTINRHTVVRAQSESQLSTGGRSVTFAREARMVLIDDWSAFQKEAQSLYSNSPSTVREIHWTCVYHYKKTTTPRKPLENLCASKPFSHFDEAGIPFSRVSQSVYHFSSHARRLD